MDSDLSRVRSILRGILVSSPIVLKVFLLNKDYHAVEGIDVPCGKFGHNTLLEFLHSIPDVLKVDGDSANSDVIYIPSEKSSHVNNLVLKQKSSSKPGQFYANKKNPKRKKKSQIAPRHQRSNGATHEKERVDEHTIKKILNDKTDEEKREFHSNEISTNNESTQKINKHNTSGPLEKSTLVTTNNSTQKYFNSSKYSLADIDLSSYFGRDDPIELSNSRIIYNRNFQQNLVQHEINPENTTHSICSSSQLSLNFKQTTEQPKGNGRQHNNFFESTPHETFVDKQSKYTNFRNNGTNNISPQISNTVINSDISWKSSRTQDQNYWKGGMTNAKEKHNDRDTQKAFNDKICLSTTRSGSSIAKNWKKSDEQRTFGRRQDSKIQRKIENNVPKKVQVNLQNLMSDFPDGLLCSDLPAAYKNLTGEDLRFECFGFRNLIFMCLDLNKIFHCIQDSSSDFKLYDARNPVPQSNITVEQCVEESIQECLSPIIQDEVWSSFLKNSVPEDAVRLGFEMKRVQVSKELSEGMILSVTVAEVYDISKFWIIIDYEDLNCLMEKMQSFYKTNSYYLVPESNLQNGLYVVVLFQNTFHRAVIINIMDAKDYVKVYYIDFGTHGVVPKSEVWFLANEFSELPIQAIRSRMSDIYPPYSGVTWSQGAIYEFFRMTSMQKMTAEIIRVDEHKNAVDIKLNKSNYYISEMLVEKGHAIFIDQEPKKHVDDPNCRPRVLYPHLFPTFEEIENWLVPCNNEVTSFLETSVTIDFLFPQYFKRKCYKDLIKSIEEKMTSNSKRKKPLHKYLKDLEEGSDITCIKEMNMLAFGSIEKTGSTREVPLETLGPIRHNENLEANELFNIENDEILASILRKKSMRKSTSFEIGDESVAVLQNINNTTYNSSGISSTVPMQNNSFFERSSDRLQDMGKISEMEKYLSEDSSSKVSSPNLIDLDVELSRPVMSSTNLLKDSEFNESMISLERSKNGQRCLLTDCTPNDDSQFEHILDIPVPEIECVTQQSNDLIDLDIEIPLKQIAHNIAHKHSEINDQIFLNSSSEFDDADDEDSEAADCDISLLPKIHRIPEKYTSLSLKLNEIKISQEQIYMSDSTRASDELHNYQGLEAKNENINSSNFLMDEHHSENSIEIIKNCVEASDAHKSDSNYNEENTQTIQRTEPISLDRLNKTTDPEEWKKHVSADLKIDSIHKTDCSDMDVEWNSSITSDLYLKTSQPDIVKSNVCISNVETTQTLSNHINQNPGLQSVTPPQPRSVLRPPPGLFPLPLNRHSAIVHPFGYQYNFFSPYFPTAPLQSLPIEHQQFFYQATPSNTCPVVVINYNFSPQMNPDSSADKTKK